MNNNYIQINKESWNKRAAVHVDSEFYDNPSFIKGRSSLNSIELDLFPELRGKSVLHLQCHFGQDTLSMARMGAHVTGVDLSDEAIQQANQLAEKIGETADFICCDIYDLPNHLDKEFDVVFTSYGTIGWFPDLDKWAGIVSQFLKPNGTFVFVEFHPVVWMFDDHFKGIQYNYFNDGPITTAESSYTENSDALMDDFVTWNHSLGEVFSALIGKGLSIESFQEYDYSPYNCFNDTTEISSGKYQIKHFGNKIPLVYALSATKK